MANKVIGYRLFSDRQGKMNYVQDIELLVVPQFTLLANTQKGRRPDFSKVAPPVLVEKYFNNFRLCILLPYASL